MKVFQLIIIDQQKDMFCSGRKKTKSNFVYIFFLPRIVQEHIRKSKRIEACRIINVYAQRAQYVFLVINSNQFRILHSYMLLL